MADRPPSSLWHSVLSCLKHSKSTLHNRKKQQRLRQLIILKENHLYVTHTLLLLQFPNNHSLEVKTILHVHVCTCTVHYIAELSCTSDLFNNFHLTQQSSFLLQRFGLKTFFTQYNSGTHLYCLKKVFGLKRCRKKEDCWVKWKLLNILLVRESSAV